MTILIKTPYNDVIISTVIQYTPFGQFQFAIMPFGLSGAPSTFQQMMDSLIKDKYNFAAAYLDDLIIFQ